MSVPLGDVADINPRGHRVADEEPVSFVGMAELDAENAVAVPLGSRTFGEVSKGYTVFNNGDVLAAKITPCWENGKIGQAHLEHPIGVGSTEFHVVRPRRDLDDRYLLHFLRQPRIKLAGELRMTGSAGQKRVPASFLSELPILLPPLPEQRRIAAILDHADALRAKRRQVLAHLDALTQSIFNDMFGGLVPDHTVGEVAEIQGGLQVSAKRSILPIEVPYLRVGNVFRGRVDLKEVKSLLATEAEIERTLLMPEDLLFVEGHANPKEVGRVAVWHGHIESCVHQNHLIRARVNRSRVSPVFAAAWLNSDAGAHHFRRAGNTTSGLNTISASTVRSAPLLLPPLPDQRRFEQRLRSVSSMQRLVGQACDSETSLFASLQSRAFRGEL